MLWLAPGRRTITLQYFAGQFDKLQAHIVRVA